MTHWMWRGHSRLWFNATPRFQIQLNTLGISRAVGKPNSGRSCIQACPQGSALYYHNQNTGNGLQSTIQILPGNLLVFQLTLTVTTVYLTLIGPFSLQSTIQILLGNNLLVFQLTLSVTTVYPNSDLQLMLVFFFWLEFTGNAGLSKQVTVIYA